jgi:hypothetical protein
VRRAIINFGLFACLLTLSPNLAAQAETTKRPVVHLALIDLALGERTQQLPPRVPGCSDDADPASLCIDDRAVYTFAGRAFYLFAPKPDQPPRRFRGVGLHTQKPPGGGRYLAIIETPENGESWVPYYAPLVEGQWCLPPDVIGVYGARLERKGGTDRPDGSWCISQKELRALQRDAKVGAKNSPYSFIAGKLIMQKFVAFPDCPPGDICMNVIKEGLLTDVETLAGRPLRRRVEMVYSGSADYRGTPRVGMIIWRQKDGRLAGAMLGPPENDQYCVSANWFYPAKDGMPVPHGHHINKNDDVCFEA